VTVHHVGFEVTDLVTSGQFYDAIFRAVGGRRMHESEDAIAYGTTGADFWLTSRSPAQPGYGHVAIRSRGRAGVDAAYRAGLAAGGTDAGPPGPRPAYGPTYYAAYLRDPDGLKVEVVADGR
jgi:catechol 2,3-dioxygenase-like lactoylglutathione lyase family enzyme